GFVSTDGKFHLRIGFRVTLERLISLAKSKTNSYVKNYELKRDQLEHDLLGKLTEVWKQGPMSSGTSDIPILIPWMKNTFENFKKQKNKFTYDNLIQQFALLLFILGGRNCYEFLRLNLPAALPHVSNVELLMRNNEQKILECEFRFQLIKEYCKSNNCNYVFSSEDATRCISRIDYDAQSDSFIGFSSCLVNGLPQPNFFQTNKFDELKLWFGTFDKSAYINLHMIQSVAPSSPPFILSTYGSNNKATATDVLKRWLYIYNQCLCQGVRVIGFSSDCDARYLRAMRLCTRFFAQLPNLNLVKQKDNFHLQIPERWSWFFMSGQQILLFMQDPIHVATKFRNRLLSEIASMKMGDYHVSIEHLINLIESKNKIEHNLIKSDICPKDRQNYASCRRISSELILQLLNKMEDCKGTYIYLSLLRSIITGLIEKSTTIQERLYHVWSVVFTCRFWWTWLQYSKLKLNYDDNDHEKIDNIKANSFITKPTFWCIEINAHTLLYIVLLVIKRKLPIDALNSYLFSSQTCENTFRIARALSGPYSSITNFTVKSFTKKCEKISIINSIKSCGGRIGEYHFKFPQHHKLEKEAHNYSINPIQKLNLTESDIEKIIESAFESAKQNIEVVNMTQLLKNEHKYSISELSQYIKTNISKSSSKVIDYTKGFDFDDESDEDNLQDDENDSSMSDDIDQISANSTDEEEENVISSDLSEVERQTFHGCRIYDKINPQQSKKYFRIYIGSSLKYIHKQTACWMLTDNRSHLSSDRLVRVRTSEM
ncbi:unnamed protein product, partial [Rotaria socialis]